MHRWEDIINMDPKEIGCKGMGWIHLPQDRGKCWALANMDGIEPLGSI